MVDMVVSATNDGGGGIFYFDSGSRELETTNVFKPVMTEGRWIRMIVTNDSNTVTWTVPQMTLIRPEQKPAYRYDMILIAFIYVLLAWFAVTIVYAWWWGRRPRRDKCDKNDN